MLVNMHMADAVCSLRGITVNNKKMYMYGWGTMGLTTSKTKGENFYATGCEGMNF